MIMKKHVLALAAICALSACGERTNPLLEADHNKIASWLYENREQFGKDKNLVDVCGEVWRTNATGDILTACNDTFAPKLATLMSTSGFGNIEPTDVQLATIWVAYQDLSKRKQRNSMSQKGLCKRYERPKNLGDFSKKKCLEYYK